MFKKGQDWRLLPSCPLRVIELIETRIWFSFDSLVYVGDLFIQSLKMFVVSTRFRVLE